MYECYKQHLSALHDTGKYRRLGSLDQDNSKDFLDFSTNDYLALSQNSQVIESAIAASRAHGVGATGSRLLSGNTILHEALEASIAQDKHTEASLIFSSGFQANLSTLSSLLDAQILKTKPIVFFDKLNHASLYQAVFLSKPTLCRYHHNDMNHLESLLAIYEHDPRPKFLVTETVFGMDGDILPLESITILAKRYKAFLYLDEAHATGVLGPNGYGLSTSVKLTEIPHLVMGTFSKALGGSGGYVACHRVIRDFLVNKASGFIYSTAPSPAIIGAAFKAWQMVRDLNAERKKLQDLGKILREKLKTIGFDIGHSTTHIVPIILGPENACLKAKEKLLAHNILVSAVRPPTVPPNASRLRMALTAHHELQDVERLVEILKKTVYPKQSGFQGGPSDRNVLPVRWGSWVDAQRT